jgi:uncharacterized protein YrrD
LDELGPRVAYLVLEEGTPVYDRRGERIGVVEHVQADEAMDVFEGLIIHTLPLPGRHLFADVDQIAELHERGVLLSVDREALHEPTDESAAKSGHLGDTLESALQARLRRAWDWLSARR